LNFVVVLGYDSCQFCELRVFSDLPIRLLSITLSCPFKHIDNLDNLSCVFEGDRSRGSGEEVG
jgi:hypothetical protein